MIKLKATSRIGKKQLERTGSTTVGDPLETPRSSNDRKTDLDQTGPKPGDTVQILEGSWRGFAGPVKWMGNSQFGGSVTVGVAVGVAVAASPKLVYVDVGAVVVTVRAAGGES